jgi:hypothetical protein
MDGEMGGPSQGAVIEPGLSIAAEAVSENRELRLIGRFSGWSEDQKSRRQSGRGSERTTSRARSTPGENASALRRLPDRPTGRLNSATCARAQFGARGSRLSARGFPAVDRRLLRRARPVARPLPRPTPETRNARRWLAALTAEECRGHRRNATRGQVGTACGRRHQRRERCATSGRRGSEAGHPDAQGGAGHSASHRGRTSGQASKSEAEPHDPHGVGMGVQSSAAPRALLRTVRRSRWICRGRGSSVACPALRARAGRLTRALLVRGCARGAPRGSGGIRSAGAVSTDGITHGNVEMSEQPEFRGEKGLAASGGEAP